VWGKEKDLRSMARQRVGERERPAFNGNVWGKDEGQEGGVAVAGEALSCAGCLGSGVNRVRCPECKRGCRAKLEAWEVQQTLSGPYDKMGCILSLQAPTPSLRTLPVSKRKSPSAGAPAPLPAFPAGD
jgi:hypothetical protein